MTGTPFCLKTYPCTRTQRLGLTGVRFTLPLRPWLGNIFPVTALMVRPGLTFAFYRLGMSLLLKSFASDMSARPRSFLFLTSSSRPVPTSSIRLITVYVGTWLVIDT